jgi:alpha-tubulin suppressor-like RCC1 family protein
MKSLIISFLSLPVMGGLVGAAGPIEIPKRVLDRERAITNRLEEAAAQTNLTRLENIAGLVGRSHCFAAGCVVSWGANGSGQATGLTKSDFMGRRVLVAGQPLTNAVAVAAGYAHALALRSDGTVSSWGRHDVPIPKDLNDVIAVAAGGSRFQRNVALKRDGRVVAWGSDGNRMPPEGLSNVVAIAAGEHHSLALKRDGAVVGWGGNGSGEAVGVATTQQPYVASGFVTIDGALLNDAVVIAAGNEYGILGTACRYSLAIRKNGTLVAWGQRGSGSVDPPAWLSNVVAIAAGQNFCLAVEDSDLKQSQR